MQNSNKFCYNIITISIVLALNGCMALPRTTVDTITDKPLTPIKLPETKEVIGLIPSERPSDQDFIEINPDSMFVSMPINDSDPLPEIRVKGLSFTNVSPYDVMRIVLAGTDISFTISNEAASSTVLHHSVSAMNISGKLSTVIAHLSDSVGFYWNYKNGVIDVTPDNQFIANIPPSNEVFESLPFMLKSLGASDVFLDKTARSVVYRATKVAQRKIAAYLDHIRRTRALIVYDTYIWEVILADGSDMGIQWNKFNAVKTGPSNSLVMTTAGGIAVSTASAIGVGVVYNTSSFALDLLAQFLQTQGTLQNISQPKLMMINGGTASFRNGVTTNYVSQVGSTTNGSATSTSVTTASVLSGIDLKISGDIFDGTVNTNIQLSLNDLQSFNQFTALGTDLKLPQIANREISTSIRSRPNDTLMIAGINISRTQNDAAGLPGMGNTITAATSRIKKSERSELVIVMRPRVIKFINDRKQDVPPLLVPITPLVTEKETVKPELIKSLSIPTSSLTEKTSKPIQNTLLPVSPPVPVNPPVLPKTAFETPLSTLTTLAMPSTEGTSKPIQNTLLPVSPPVPVNPPVLPKTAFETPLSTLTTLAMPSTEGTSEVLIFSSKPKNSLSENNIIQTSSQNLLESLLSAGDSIENNVPKKKIND